MNGLFNALERVVALGGPVVVILIGVAILTTAVILYKLWQFSAAGVGRHKALAEAVRAWDQGDRPGAQAALTRSKSYLAPVVDMAFTATPQDQTRLEAEAESRFARLEGGMRLLDSVAQLAPLLGLFGTVLGMIEAFQSMQQAGSQVDPSLLAGGIWVALLTTAVGLAVAMPTSIVHSWFESRMDRERVIAERAIATILFPQGRGRVARAGQEAAFGPA